MVIKTILSRSFRRYRSCDYSISLRLYKVKLSLSEKKSTVGFKKMLFNSKRTPIGVLEVNFFNKP